MRVIPYTQKNSFLKYPMFHCPTYDDYLEVCQWMKEDGVEYYLWMSGGTGYLFDVRGGNADWFLLRFS